MKVSKSLLLSSTILVTFLICIFLIFLRFHSSWHFGWRKYTNNTFGYSLIYPPDWKIDTSRAEPKFDLAHPSEPCPFMNELKITPPNNLGSLFILYGRDCLGGQPSSSSLFFNTSIDHQDAKKIYVNTCDSYYPSSKAPVSCANQIRGIIFAEPECNVEDLIPNVSKFIACGKISDYINIRGQLVRINFGASNFNQGIPLYDANFKKLDQQIDAIVATFTVSQKPPHPEVN